MLCDVGTEIVVATPHFYPHVHNVDEFLNNVEKSLSRLYEVGIEKAPRICVGAEVLICENIEKLDGLDKLCIRGTKILLLELPSEGLSPTHLKTVETIMENGYTVVLAHIDRYIKEHEDYIKLLLEMGALAQINPYAMATFGPKKQILNILSTSESIVAVGSDLHGSSKGALDGFIKLKKRLGSHYDAINKRAAALLANAQIIDLTKKD
jgi:protein-tyrosine phosphatase